jgi:protease-4
MKKFFANIFSSCFGTILGLGGLLFIVISIAGSFSDTEPAVKPNSILMLDLSSKVPEQTGNVEVNIMDFENLDNPNIGLVDMVHLIRVAAKDKDISGIYLKGASSANGFATSQKLRKELTAFKESGKFVIAYANNYSQNGYYLSSAASSIYVNPLGSVDFRGFAAQLMFYKGLMDKVGVKAQIYYAGKFKSATEPFRLKSMSEPNKKQVREYVGGAYNLFLEDVSEAREIPVDSLKAYANRFALRTADDCLNLKFVDGVKYKDEVLTELREKTGLNDKDKINFVGVNSYYKAKNL